MMKIYNNCKFSLLARKNSPGLEGFVIDWLVEYMRYSPWPPLVELDPNNIPRALCLVEECIEECECIALATRVVKVTIKSE